MKDLEKKVKISTKHYIEMFWIKYLDEKNMFDLPCETSIIPVFERDPLLFDNAANRKVIAGFRFFDVTEAIYNGEKLFGERKNFSPIFYYGRRLSTNNDVELGMFWSNFMREKGIKTVIKCDCGCFITNPEEGSMTIEEYKSKLLIDKDNAKQNMKRK